MIASVLLIFRKDVRRLWPNVLAFWAVMAGATALSCINSDRFRWSRNNLLPSAVPLQWLACWLLVVLLIQQERLVGHEQYWLTRPFSWKALLAAKTLFLATMVGPPLWICNILVRDRLLQPIPLTVFLILPAVAFAAVTSNLGQALLAFVGTAFVLTVLSPQIERLRADRLVPALLVALLSLAVILFQYSSRRETLARSLLLAGAAGLLILTRF
jgi:hypothetical protein